jgi:hypothetical protein
MWPITSCFDNAAYGIHSYSASTTSSQRGLTFEGNSVFNNGMITLDDQYAENVRNSTLRPTGVNIFVRPNKYEIGRGNITVYNWDLSPTVVVDIASLGLKWGEAFEVLDAQNYFGPPVTTGIYDGQLLVLPMNLTVPAVPASNVERTPRHTAPEFAVFVVRKH